MTEIPEGGLVTGGELPASLFDLDPEDSIRATGPVRFEARIRRFDDHLVFSGSLSGRFQLQCGLCLDYFDYEADYPEWESDFDLEEGEVSFDLAAVIREDFLLNLPSSPRCEDFHPERPCPRAARLRELQEQAEEGDGEDPEDGRPPSDVWKALDDLAP